MDIVSNFWKENPEFELIYDDEFIKRADSSKIMWSIYLYVDPRAITALESNEDERLLYIQRKFFRDFDPEDPYIIDKIDLYMQFIPEPELTYKELLVQCRDMLKFYKNIDIENKEVDKKGNVKKNSPGTQLSLAKDKVDGLTKAQVLLDKVLAKRKDLQASRATVEKKGLAGYTPSRLESGSFGRGSS